MELTSEVKALLLNTAKELKGSVRRMFMARTVQALGEGGQRLAERVLGWNRGTIRKGMREVDRFGEERYHDIGVASNRADMTESSSRLSCRKTLAAP